MRSLKAAQKPEYSHIIDAAVKYAKVVTNSLSDHQEHEKEDKKKMMTILVDKLSVLFGKAILDVVPGLVSTEVDARISFDTEKMIEKWAFSPCNDFSGPAPSSRCTRRKASRRTAF